MSRSIALQVAAKKGALAQKLNVAIAQLSADQEEPLDPDLLRVLEGARQAVHKLVHPAPAGSLIEVGVPITGDPFGGWRINVMVDVHVPRKTGGR